MTHRRGFLASLLGLIGLGTVKASLEPVKIPQKEPDRLESLFWKHGFCITNGEVDLYRSNSLNSQFVQIRGIQMSENLHDVNMDEIRRDLLKVRRPVRYKGKQYLLTPWAVVVKGRDLWFEGVLS